MVTEFSVFPKGYRCDEQMTLLCFSESTEQAPHARATRRLGRVDNWALWVLLCPTFGMLIGAQKADVAFRQV